MPLEGCYTDNDRWSTNEFDVDWQVVTLYNPGRGGIPDAAPGSNKAKASAR